jgi:hypothetical protein
MQVYSFETGKWLSERNGEIRSYKPNCNRSQRCIWHSWSSNTHWCTQKPILYLWLSSDGLIHTYVRVFDEFALIQRHHHRVSYSVVFHRGDVYVCGYILHMQVLCLTSFLSQSRSKHLQAITLQIKSSDLHLFTTKSKQFKNLKHAQGSLMTGWIKINWKWTLPKRNLLYSVVGNNWTDAAQNL